MTGGDNDRLLTFLHSLQGPEETGGYPFAAKRKQAEEAGVPIIRLEMESFLHVLLELRRPERILEVGTATGYSAMRMASFTPPETTITTIENYEPRIREAEKNFETCPWKERLFLIGKDAQEALCQLESDSYDMVFMDAAKAQYIHYLPQVLRVMKTGALLVSDNVLQDGVLLESRYAVDRRDRTIHARMREYLHALCRTQGLVTSVVPIADGVALTYKQSSAAKWPGRSLCTDRE